MEITCGTSICTVQLTVPNFIVINQKEESISIQRVNAKGLLI